MIKLLRLKKTNREVALQIIEITDVLVEKQKQTGVVQKEEQDG